MCDPLNRTGIFCSHCKEGLGPALLNYSYPCLECTSYGWAAYFALTIVPATLFCMIFIFLHIDLTSPTISYVIFHCQVMAGYFRQQPNSLFTQHREVRKIFVTIISFWNVEFFREFIPSFCTSSTMSTNTVVALEYVAALYPFFFIVIVYIVIELHDRGCRLLVFFWKPLHRHVVKLRKSWDIRGSVINAFTAFLCLTYSKIMSTSFILLYRPQVDGNCIEQQVIGGTRPYLNASISTKMTLTPHFYVATIIPSLFCVLPLVIMLFHQTRLFRSASARPGLDFLCTKW